MSLFICPNSLYNQPFKLTPIIEYFHIDKLPIHGKLLHKTIETTFIQSGGGTGPMKPGNR